MGYGGVGCSIEKDAVYLEKPVLITGPKISQHWIGLKDQIPNVM